MRDEAGEDSDWDAPDIPDLWYIEERTDVAEWLTEHNWELTLVEAKELMTRYGRCAPEQDETVAPRTVFIHGQLVC